MERSVLTSSMQRSPLVRRGGFTLIEILVATVIILLVLGMALPAFRVITGGRSEAGAINAIAAMLTRARTDALGQQKPIGVAFIYNPSLQQSYMAEVYFPYVELLKTGSASATYYYYVSTPSTSNPSSVLSYHYGATTNSPYNVYGPPLDIIPGSKLMPLPSGIGVQTIFNCTYSGTTRTSDGYLSFGVILFDSLGRLTSLPYGVSEYSQLAIATGVHQANTTQYYQYPSLKIAASNNRSITQYGVYSQLGLVLYQLEPFQSHMSQLQIDAVYYTRTGSYASGTPSQRDEETWLDQNASPLLIDRYTGKLVRPE